MSYLKNLLFLFAAAMLAAPAIAADYAFITRNTPSVEIPPANALRIEWDGNTARAYESMPPQWKVTLPEDFPKNCLATAITQSGKRVTCEPVKVFLRAYFDLETLSIRESVLEKNYTVQIDASGPIVSKASGTPVERQIKGLSFLGIHVIAFMVMALGIANALTSTNRMRLLIAYGAILGATALGAGIGEVAGDVAGMLAGGLAVGLAVGFAGGRAGGFAGGFAGTFAGMLTGGLAGVLAAQYGWEGAGVNEYLVFLAIACVVGFALRELVTFARNRLSPEPGDDDGEGRPAGILD